MIIYTIPGLFIILLIAVALGAGVGLAAWISIHYVIIGIVIIALKMLMVLFCWWAMKDSKDEKERFKGDDVFLAFLCEAISSIILMVALSQFAPIITESFCGLIGGCVAVVLNVIATFLGAFCTMCKWRVASIGIPVVGYLLCVIW